MTPRELREQRARIITNAQSKLDEITDDTDEARAAEIEAEFDAMVTEAEALEARAARLDRLAALQSSVADPDPRRPVADGEAEGRQEDAAEPSYRDAFHAWLGAGGDMSEMPVEARNVLRAQQLPPEVRQQVAGNAAAGGNLVPEEMRQELVKAMAIWGPMYDDDVAMVINTTGGASMPFPTVDDTANEADPQTAEGEGHADDASGDVTFGRGTLEDFMFKTPWVNWSLELSTGSFTNIESVLNQLLGERLGRSANRQLTTGSGVGAPQGFLTGSSFGKTAASSTTVTSDEIMDLIHSVDQAYRQSPKAGLQFNDNTLLALHKLKDGQGNYLLNQANTTESILRIGQVAARYRINQAMPNMASGARSMAYGDFSRYFVRKIGAPIIGVLQDKSNWPNYSIAGYVRLDGILADTTAIRHLVHA